MRVTPSERQRRRRRRLLVWGGLPLWLTAMVLGLHLALLNAIAGAAANDYAEGEIGAANVGFTYLKSTNVVERWKAPYNLGTSLVRGDEAWIGVFYLYDALELAPEDDLEIRCTIGINLAIGQEMVGDEDLAIAKERRAWAIEAQSYVDAGEPYPAAAPWGDSTPDELWDEAKQHAAWAAMEYQEALDARAPCQSQDPPPEEQEEEESETTERLEDKRDEAEAQGEPPPEAQDADAEADAEEQRRQEELNARNAEAAAEAEAQRQEEEGGGGGGATQGW